MATAPPVLWADDPEEHDYPAAADYLSLIVPPALAARLVEELRAAPTVHHKAKDILRASGLLPLERTNPHVASDLRKISKGKALSPVLLVQGDLVTGVQLQVADGYHRVCASYLTDENTPIPCRVAAFPAP